MSKIKTLKDLGDNEELCKYCPLPEESQGVRCYGGQPIMCEGSHCKEAYDAYLEEMDEEQSEIDVIESDWHNDYLKYKSKE